MDRHNGIAGVILAREKSFSLEPVDQLAQRIYFAAKIGIDAFAFASQIKVGDYIVAAAPEVRTEPALRNSCCTPFTETETCSPLVL